MELFPVPIKSLFKCVGVLHSWIECMRCFDDMSLQHSQRGVLQGAEWLVNEGDRNE